MSASTANTGSNGNPTAALRHKVLVWDLPTRIFHWLLVLLVGVSFVTGNMGGTAMQYHEWSGVTILVLVVFRFFWGFWGGEQTRFRVFVRGPQAAFDYLRALAGGKSGSYLGHNPLGGWSIIAMLLALAVQVGTGLFANDDILFEGPLYLRVSKDTSDLLTRFHHFNKNILVGLVLLHILAVFFYLVVKRDNLIKPMLTGHKQWHEKVDASKGSVTAAIVVAAALAALVYLLLYRLPG